jgi:hypothetical protein
MTVPTKAPSIADTLKNPALAAQVDAAMHDIAAMTAALTKAGLSEEQARLKVQQIYFHNLQTFSDPLAASIALLAELKTRIDLDRVINPQSSLINGQYLDLNEEMRKTIKLVLEAQQKGVAFKVQVDNDKAMKFPAFIDVEGA